MIAPRLAPLRCAVRLCAALAAALAIVLTLMYGTAAQEQDEDPADTGPLPGAIGQPVQPIDSKHLYDQANLLTNDEEAKVELDAARLHRFGIPALILLQVSDMAPEEASAFAAEVREGWGVESAPGANDGLVMVVVADTSEEQNAYTVMSWGDDAFPHFGIDASVADGVHREWLDAYVQDGQVYEGILFSLRRLVYHSIYEPAPAPPLTDTQETVRTLVSWTAPLVAIAAVAATFAYWNRGRGNRLPSGASEFVTWGIPVATIIVAAAAVWSHSEPGIGSAIVLLAMTAIGWVRRDPAVQREVPQGGMP
ncbi:MAG TPA: hypothetical protein VD789_03170 [Thermomicrobiales bacterium]|nr:hypothetical protein [Thermomicrobiales bacterium]